MHSYLSDEQYEINCRDFFDKVDFSTFASLSTEDFFAWYLKILDDNYQLTSGPIKSYVREAGESYQEPQHQKVIGNYHAIANKVFQECFMQIVQSRYDEYFATKAQKAREAALQIKVQGVDYHALAIIPVLWSGWECDDKAWIVEVEGKKKLVTSNHGALSFTDKEFLEDKIKEYQEAIAESEKFLADIS